MIIKILIKIQQIIALNSQALIAKLASKTHSLEIVMEYQHPFQQTTSISSQTSRVAVTISILAQAVACTVNPPLPLGQVQVALK